MFRQTTKTVLKKKGIHAGEKELYWTSFTTTAQGWFKAEDVLATIMLAWLPWIRQCKKNATVEYAWEGGVKRTTIMPDGVSVHWGKNSPFGKQRGRVKGKITLISPYVMGEGHTTVIIYVR